MLPSRVLLVSRSLLLSLLAGAPLVAQSVPPVRPIGPVMRVSPAGLLASVTYVRALPNGDALVHDLIGRKVVLLDASLELKRLVADTTAATASAYTSHFAGLIRYRGDSSLFVDPDAVTMSVISADGALLRTLAIPRPQDASLMVGGPLGTPAVDSSYRIVFRSFAPVSRNRTPPPPPEPGQPVRLAPPPDSAPVIRVDLRSRASDTLAWVRVPVTRLEVMETAKGNRLKTRVNPLPTVDDWTLLPDGRLAVLRGRDYHLDWLELSGVWRSTPRIPYAWERLTDEDKARLIDSVEVGFREQRERMNRKTRDGVPEGGAAARVATPQFQAPEPYPVESKELPDYRPAFRQGAMSADDQGRLWIRTTSPSDSGPIYDVVDSSGRLLDRVKLPYGRVISGFGAGVVFMGVLDEQGARLEMARIR